ncbi:MAG: LLM class flavin-dependent oxidoreductase [Candidatus Dormibacteria bacterium]
MGYGSAWTPSGGDERAFQRCQEWHQATGLRTGILVVPASGLAVEDCAQAAGRTWIATQGNFALGVGSGRLDHPVSGMAQYLHRLRPLLEGPLYVAALGPRMLALAAELGDGVALNWCSKEQVRWSRARITAAAQARPRPPRVVEYIRASVDPDPGRALLALQRAVHPYAFGVPAYHRHFERMGFGPSLAEAERRHQGLPPEVLAQVGAWGAPGSVRPQVEALAEGLDLAIVRVVASQPGSLSSVAAVLRECAREDRPA